MPSLVKFVAAAGAGLALNFAIPAAAQDFSGTGLPQADPMFAGGATTATFSGPNQSFGSYTENGITLSAGRVDNSFADDYNSFGSYYDNDEGNLSTISLAFANPASAFAFNWGAADVIWDLEIFSGLTSLSTYALTPTFASNAKEYYGFSGSAITSAVLTARSGGDWVFIDNLTVASDVAGAVPEPSTWLMMLFGFGMIGYGMRSAKRRSDEKFETKIKNITYGIA